VQSSVTAIWLLPFALRVVPLLFSLAREPGEAHDGNKATAGGAMHQHISMEIGIDEDDTVTLVHAVLDLRGDHFTATGSARRNPIDANLPVVGEELALARALGSLEDQVIDAAYAKIDGISTVSL
jgi:hypothetical protein